MSNLDFWIFNVVNSSIVNNFTTLQSFQGPWKILKDNKMFFKGQGHSVLTENLRKVLGAQGRLATLFKSIAYCE